MEWEQKMTAHKKILLDAASERADDILMVYKKFAEKKPVMLLELPSQLHLRLPLSRFQEHLEREEKPPPTRPWLLIALAAGLVLGVAVSWCCPVRWRWLSPC